MDARGWIVSAVIAVVLGAPSLYALYYAIRAESIARKAWLAVVCLAWFMVWIVIMLYLFFSGYS